MRLPVSGNSNLSLIALSGFDHGAPSVWFEAP
jgi:hypothetical protein